MCIYSLFYVVFVFFPVLLLSAVAVLVLRITPEAFVSVKEYELSHWDLSPGPGNSFYQTGWDILAYSVLFFFSKMDELYNRDHNRRTDAFFFFSFLRRSHRRVEKTKSKHETLTVRIAETEVKTSHTANTGNKWWTFSWHRQTCFMGSSVKLNAMKGWNYFHSISFSGGSSKAWMSWCLFRHNVFMLYLQTKLHIPFNKMSWSHSCQSYRQTFVL